MKLTDPTYRNNLFIYWEWIKAKKLFVGLVLCLLFNLRLSAHTSSAKSYLLHYAPLAQSLSARSGIPASVILGIALIESGHGSSSNCKTLKNHFGIKGTNHLPAQGIHYRSMYRSYSCDEASFGHFCHVVKRKAYYKKLKGNRDYNLWLQSINQGYYSSAGLIWVNKIKKAIEIHRLTRFDSPTIQLSCSPKMNWLHTYNKSSISGYCLRN